MGSQQERVLREPEERLRLLRGARRGDAAAFRALFAPDFDLAWRMALRITGEPAGADDALQEGLISAYRALDRVEPRNLRGWFVRIVQNAARDAARRERRRPTLSLERSDAASSTASRTAPFEPTAGDASDPARTAERRELARELAQALSGIAEERRTAILLYDVDGYDYVEIAEITACSVGTVKSRISRGRAELRTLLADLRPGTKTRAAPLRSGDE